METEGSGDPVAPQLKIINWPAFFSNAVSKSSFRVQRMVRRKKSLERRLFDARRLMRVIVGLIKRGGLVNSNSGNQEQMASFTNNY